MEYIEDSSDSEDLESSEWFIKKPFDPSDFTEVINTFLNLIMCILILLGYLSVLNFRL